MHRVNSVRHSVISIKKVQQLTRRRHHGGIQLIMRLTRNAIDHAFVSTSRQTVDDDDDDDDRHADGGVIIAAVAPFGLCPPGSRVAGHHRRSCLSDRHSLVDIQTSSSSLIVTACPGGRAASPSCADRRPRCWYCGRTDSEDPRAISIAVSRHGNRVVAVFLPNPFPPPSSPGNNGQNLPFRYAAPRPRNRRPRREAMTSLDRWRQNANDASCAHVENVSSRRRILNGAASARWPVGIVKGQDRFYVLSVVDETIVTEDDEEVRQWMQKNGINRRD